MNGKNECPHGVEGKLPALPSITQLTGLLYFSSTAPFLPPLTALALGSLRVPYPSSNPSRHLT